jgi:hypothetical protein
MEVRGQLHAPAALLPRQRSPDTHWIGDWVGSRAVLDAMYPILIKFDSLYKTWLRCPTVILQEPYPKETIHATKQTTFFRSSCSLAIRNVIQASCTKNRNENNKSITRHDENLIQPVNRPSICGTTSTKEEGVVFSYLTPFFKQEVNRLTAILPSSR